MELLVRMATGRLTTAPRTTKNATLDTMLRHTTSDIHPPRTRQAPAALALYAMHSAARTRPRSSWLSATARCRRLHTTLILSSIAATATAPITDRVNKEQRPADRRGPNFCWARVCMELATPRPLKLAAVFFCAAVTLTHS